MRVFDLTEMQANYILEMPLRRLTKFSRIELERERRSCEPDRRAERDPRRRRQAAPGRLRRARRRSRRSTARRGGRCCSSPAGPATTVAAVPLEVADDPCWVLLSSTGLLARTHDLSERDPPRRADQARRDRVRSHDDGPRQGRARHPPGGWCAVRRSTCPRSRRPQRALSGRRRAVSRVPRAGPRRAGARAALGSSPTGPAWRSAPKGVVKRVTPDYPRTATSSR